MEVEDSSMKQQERSRTRINIAIDGPAGAGKSTVARMVAEQLGYIYIDTGAMYRAVTLTALTNGIEPDQGDRLAALLDGLDIRLEPGEGRQRVFVGGEDVTEDIRSRDVTNRVSRVSAIEAVRIFLVDKQRELASGKGVVMDGRDIGSVVLPDAELKIFLTASVRERAERRYLEIGEKQQLTLEQLEREIADRDRMDQEREISPLICAPDAVVLDSTSLSIAEVILAIIELSRTKMGEAK
jgi:cytidylate kinase